MNALIEKLAEATGPDRDLDAWIAVATTETVKTDDDLVYAKQRDRSGGDATHPGQYFIQSRSGASCRTAPAFTASIDAALTLVPDGCNYIMGRGRTRPEEPVAGAIIFSGPYSDNEQELGDGEHDSSLAIAICIAALEARASIRESGTRPTGEPGVTSPPAPEASGPVGRGLAEGELP